MKFLINLSSFSHKNLTKMSYILHFPLNDGGGAESQKFSHLDLGWVRVMCAEFLGIIGHIIIRNYIVKFS